MKKVYKNSALNIAAQGLVMAVMFFAVPRIVTGLGNVSFAIMSLVWTVMTYFTLWDLGIGRAVTKFVAEKKALGENNNVVSLVLFSTAIAVLLGVLFGSLIFLFDSQLAELLFKVPVAFEQTVRVSLRLVAISMPILFLQSVFRGILMGIDRFDLSNSVQILNGFLQWGGALILVLLHFGVLWVIGAIVLSRLITTVILLAMISWNIDLKKFSGVFDVSLLKNVLSFGGWAMVSQIVSPVLQYAERFMLSAMVATGLVTFYIVPYEATSKMLVLSVGLVSALFPAMSEIHGVGGIGSDLQSLFSQAERILVFAFLPIGTFLFAFAPEILRVWMGASFAPDAAPVFEVLSLAFLLNSVGQLPFTVLQAVGRADLTGRIHLVELPIHLLFSFLLIRTFGLMGAAAATLLRVIVDVILLYSVTSKKLGLKIEILKGFLKRTAPPLLCLIGGVVCMLAFQRFIAVKIVFAVVSFSLYGFIVFKFSLQESERKFLLHFALRRASV